MKQSKWEGRFFCVNPTTFFKVEKEIHVVKNLYKLEVRLVNAGIFSNLTIDFTSDEIEKEIENGRAKEVYQ